MKSIFILLIFGLCLYGVEGKLEYLEILNLKAWNTHALLNSNETKTIKEESRAKPRGFFENMYGKVFGTLPKNAPQIDLNELAQIFATLNVADISTIIFLKKNCKNSVLDASMDANLCEKYPEILIKQVQNRLDAVNTKLFLSKGTLKCPPNWLKHTISATELLKDIDTQNQLEYKVKQAVTKAVLAEEEDINEDDKNKQNVPAKEGAREDVREREREGAGAGEDARERERTISNYEKIPNPQMIQSTQNYKRKPCFSINLPMQIITQPVQAIQAQPPVPAPPPAPPAQMSQESEQTRENKISEDTTSTELKSLLNSLNVQPAAAAAAVQALNPQLASQDSTPNVVVKI